MPVKHDVTLSRNWHLSASERGRRATPGAGGTTYVFVAVGAGQVERRAAAAVPHLGAGSVVQ